MSDIYEPWTRLIINAYAPPTRFGSGIMAPGGRAMAAATQQHRFDSGQRRPDHRQSPARRRAASLRGFGRSARRPAACVTGLDPAKMEQLPDTRVCQWVIVVAASAIPTTMRCAPWASPWYGLGFPSLRGLRRQGCRALGVKDAITDKTAAILSPPIPGRLCRRWGKWP
jgi:hypothetical protein